MRLVKLGTGEFPMERDLQTYFAKELPTRNPPGLFIFGNRIAEDGLQPGETVLFTYNTKLRFVAKTKTGRMKNIYLRQTDYPYCFEIDMQSLRQANVPLSEVERQLREGAGLQRSLQGQAWTKIPDSERAEQIIETLIS